MSMYLFNVFNESKDKDHVTTILTCLDTKTRFFLKKLFLKSNSLLYLQKYPINQNKNYI